MTKEQDMILAREACAGVIERRGAKPVVAVLAGGLDNSDAIQSALAAIQAERERIVAWLDRGEPDWPWTAQDIAAFIRAGCPEITSGAGPSGIYTLDTFPDAA